jgi:hypothetical protein
MKRLGLYLLITGLGLSVASAQTGPLPNPRIVIRSGVVEVERGNSWHWIAAGDLLRTGERLRTGTGSRTAIQFGSDKVITLNESSQVRIGDAGTVPLVQLESGSMRVFSASPIQVAAKDTVLETADLPADLELGLDAANVNVVVFSGAVRSGQIIMRGNDRDATVRTYTAGRAAHTHAHIENNPTFYVYPNSLFGNADPTAGRIVPPVVNNSTNPGYRPTQIVPPMSDPIRVPVVPPAPNNR